MTIDVRGIRGALLAATVVAVAACGDAQANGAREGEGGDSAAFIRVINVEVTEVELRAFVEQIPLTGTVRANRDVTVSAEESGTITEILVDKGRAVSAGEPILRIDDRILRSQVDEARAQAALAEETWQRRKRLWEEDQVGSELAYLEARYQAEQARARLNNLEERLERTTIRAPIEGVLDDRTVEVGTLVGPGTPVARIIDLNPVKIAAGVPERYAPDVSRGAEATVTFDVLEDEVHQATVEYVGAAVDRRNRTFPVELVLPNPGGIIKPEMVANVSVVRRRIDDAVVVPQEAVIRVEDGFRVFVVEGESDEARVAARSVILGPSQNNEVVVREGLEGGERLVVVGQQQVAAGDRVRVVGGDR